MERPLVVLKPNIPNAIVPVFLRNIFYAVLLFVPIYILLNLLKYINTVVLIWLIALMFLFSFIPLLYTIIILHFTTYYFFNNRVLSEFKFIKIERHSAPYNRIVNIREDISIWDRLCKAGDIIIHTAENKAEDLKLRYIKNPNKVQTGIYNLIQRSKNKRRY